MHITFPGVIASNTLSSAVLVAFVAGESLITKIGKAFLELIALSMAPKREVEFFEARLPRTRPL